ncbi:MAG: hypothetical protein M0Z28_21085 [Rhodospirillales bacterium]|nr:hypothetical protein [Rhodospirillales bacterium]
MTDLVSIEGDDIVIRITPDALRFASENGVLSTFCPQKNDFRTVRVTDLAAWRAEMISALNREFENGDTPVHLLLDSCLQYAVDQGGEGIEIEGVLP